MKATKGRFIDITTIMRINIALYPCQKVVMRLRIRKILQLSFSQITKRQLASKNVGVYPSYTPPPAFPPYARIESHFPLNLQLASKNVGVYPSYTPPPAFPPYARIESHFPFNLHICSFTDMKKCSRDLFLSYRVSLCHSNGQL